MKLPNGDRADLGVKLEEYVLNPRHRDGRHKARVFESALGITLDNQAVLRQAILGAATTSTQAVLRGDNGHGELYAFRFVLRTEMGSATVLTAWIILPGEDIPRLTTCYIVWRMTDHVPLHASVALVNDVQATHFESGAPMVLRRGDVGTVVLAYGNGEHEVEFADRTGRTYAMLPLPSACMLVLRDAPDMPEGAVIASGARGA